jgi:pimeloyl-[acyl-carrier protein] methyl ester esterase
MIQPYFEKIGEGDELVLLHGWGVHGGIFSHLYPTLGRHFSITNIDLPGFGRSPLPNTEYSIEMIAEQILSVVPNKAHFLGWSLGGLVASYLAINHPDRINKLITVASNPFFVATDDWPHGMSDQVMNNFMSMLAEDYETTLIRFLAIQTMGSETQKQDIQRLKETVFLHGQPAQKALAGGLSILNNCDLRQAMANSNLPHLRIYGRLDSLVSEKSAMDIDKLLPNSTKYTFRKASHAPFLSHAEEFNQQVIDFLTE